MITGMTIRLADGSTVELAPRQTEPRYYVLEDQYTARFNYQVRNSAPAPAVFRTGVADDTSSFRRSPFTRAWQWYAVELLCLRMYGARWAGLSSLQRDFIEQKFRALYSGATAFTNGAGVDTKANYISAENLGAGDPSIDPLVCASNLLAGTETTNSKGQPVLQVRGFLYSETPPEPDLNDPRVLHATIIQETGALTQFPELDGLPVPYPYIQREPYYYPLRELRRVT